MLGRGLVLNGGVELPFPALPGDLDTQGRQQIHQICMQPLGSSTDLEFLCLGNEGGRIRSFPVVLKECRQSGPMEMPRESEDYIQSWKCCLETTEKY